MQMGLDHQYWKKKIIHSQYVQTPAEKYNPLNGPPFEGFVYSLLIQIKRSERIHLSTKSSGPFILFCSPVPIFFYD